MVFRSAYEIVKIDSIHYNNYGNNPASATFQSMLLLLLTPMYFVFSQTPWFFVEFFSIVTAAVVS
jgi:hypothetical protein